MLGWTPHATLLTIALLGLLACGSSSDTPQTDGSSSSGGIDVGCQPNGMQDGDETDIDCGGASCSGCGVGDACVLDGDCLGNSCVDGRCVAPTCGDGVHNQGESDVDCGGPCLNCSTGQRCVVADDCTSAMCEGDICVAPPCQNGMVDPGETDVDCGGPSCGSCDNGQACAENTDCASMFCNAMDQCQARSCQGDDDCGFLDGPCADGVCNLETYSCDTMGVNEGQDCDDGDPCTLGTVCTATVCEGGAPPDCTAFDDDCNMGTCNPGDGSCEATPINEAGACDDGDPCTAGDVCTAGVCADPDGSDVHLDEDFSDNGLGWTLGSDWEIGPATASPTGDVGGADPDTDNTATADNGVAGVLIGGLVSGSGPARYIESPVLDLAAAPGDLQLRLYRWLNADINGEMQETIEVYDGNDWVILFQNADQVIADTAWTEMTFDITPYKNANLQVRIGHDPAGNSAAVGGWNIDDVRIAPAICP